MQTSKEIQAQIEQLKAQLIETRRSEIGGAVAQIKSIMDEFGLTQQDLFGHSVQVAKFKEMKISKTAEPKYRDPATGTTWSGRGLKPKWLATALATGKSQEDFLIVK